MVRRLLVILLQALTGLLVILALWIVSHLAGDRPPPGPVVCAANGTSGCTLTNIYGSFSDRAICRAANVTYPRTEEELVAAVAAAVAAGRKVKVATRYSNSFPRLACPGGEDGTVISTRWLDRAVRVDAARRLMTVESGMVMRDLIREAAAAGLALPHSPYWSGLTIGGVLATGAHGSSLWGKGSAVHEYVVGMRIVTPAPASEGFAAVRELAAGDPDLDAAKVSLGVLGAISQVTLELQPLFKRSVAFVTRNDSDVADTVAAWGRLHEFGDVAWLPRRRVAVYREDDRVDVATPGDGRSDYPAFRPTPTLPLVASRLAEEWLEERSGSDAARCAASRVMPATLEHLNYGLTNDGEAFTGYPVVGYQHRIQASSLCTGAMEDDGHIPTYNCLWNGAPGTPLLQLRLQHRAVARAGVRRRRRAAPRPQPGGVLPDRLQDGPADALRRGVVGVPRQGGGLGGLRRHLLPELRPRRAARARRRVRRGRADGAAQARRRAALGQEPQLRLRRRHRQVPQRRQVHEGEGQVRSRRRLLQRVERPGARRRRGEPGHRRRRLRHGGALRVLRRLALRAGEGLLLPAGEGVHGGEGVLAVAARRCEWRRRRRRNIGRWR
ncbi:Os04g0361500 [Oryza sativa Japonica Group]|uniref:L-gulonolactone oxidase n=1 Tax=Oryza sativa subsp. japonica TaxID=39947 RepID=A0A0P0W9H9_ORYSJ|nr:Os04g0361500 [Oryza sativa Japonica Group]